MGSDLDDVGVDAPSPSGARLSASASARTHAPRVNVETTRTLPRRLSASGRAHPPLVRVSSLDIPHHVLVYAARCDPISPAQAAILAECASGSSVKETARKLNYSPGSVSWNIHKARERLHAGSLAHAAMIAMQLGYLSQPTGPDMRIVSLLPR